MMNKQRVMEFLPHRDPFLFIDTVVELVLNDTVKDKKGPLTPTELVGSKSVCTFKVDSSVKVLEGHFPGNPILPGVVQVEMMAQAASFVATKCLDGDFNDYKIEVILISIDQARFRRPVIPPMDLVIHSTLTKVRGPIQMYECEIYCGEDLISQCSVMASLKFDKK